MSSSASPDIVTNGLVLCLDAADKKSYPGSGTTWFDRSSNGNHGTLTNGPTFNSANGGSIVFDGTNDRVECGTFSVPLVTVSTWVYKTSNITEQGICRKNNSWALSIYQGFLQVAIGNNWNFLNTGYAIPLNTWVNIAYTSNGTGLAGSIVVYINGLSIFSVSSPAGNITANTNQVYIGYDDNNWFWSGRIAQTLIYNRALTAEEIKQNFNNTKSKFNIL